AALEWEPYLLSERVIRRVIEVAEAVITLGGGPVQLVADARVDGDALRDAPGVLKVPTVVQPRDRAEGRLLHIAAGTCSKQQRRDGIARRGAAGLRRGTGSHPARDAEIGRENSAARQHGRIAREAELEAVRSHLF